MSFISKYAVQLDPSALNCTSANLPSLDANTLRHIFLKNGETKKSIALSEGLPIDSELYTDEAFAFYEIPVEALQEIIIPKGEHSKSEGNLSGLTFVITGSLEHYTNRDELVEYIESSGGKVVKAISNKVNYLINNDITSTSTKNITAKELNIPIISEEEFIKISNKL